MKKIFGSVLALALGASLITPASLFADEKKDDVKKPVVTVTTTFLNDMVKNLVKDGEVELQLIIPAGGDPHLYEAKPEDLTKLADADLVLYHGLHFEGKMVEALEQAKSVAVSENFPKEKIGEMEEDGETIIDPHFWFDLDLYSMATDRAAEALKELLPEQSEMITKNLADYQNELKELDKYIHEKLDPIPEESRYLVSPHDAFNYFGRAYKFTPIAPQGVSTDSEVSNKDLEETAKFIVEHKIKAIFAESSTNPQRMEKLRDTVKSLGGEVEALVDEDHQIFSDSLAAEGEHGETFIDMYKHNVDLIAEYMN